MDFFLLNINLYYIIHLNIPFHKLYLDCKAARYSSKRNLSDAVDKILAKKKLEQKISAQKQAKNIKKNK